MKTSMTAFVFTGVIYAFRKMLFVIEHKLADSSFAQEYIDLHALVKASKTTLSLYPKQRAVWLHRNKIQMRQSQTSNRNFLRKGDRRLLKIVPIEPYSLVHGVVFHLYKQKPHFLLERADENADKSR
jgi:hypothetical protein